jgi:hypothetical protein
MTTNKHRIHMVHSIPQMLPLGVHLVGNPCKLTSGFLDGISVLALPDSGAEPNIVSKKYAMSRGWKIFGEPTVLQFADGSTQRSLGQVRATWSTKTSSSMFLKQRTFEVLSGCPFDVILGQDIVYKSRVYESLDGDNLHEDVSNFNLVIVIPKILKKFWRPRLGMFLLLYIDWGKYLLFDF